jgi:hypothetical protein
MVVQYQADANLAEFAAAMNVSGESLQPIGFATSRGPRHSTVVVGDAADQVILPQLRTRCRFLPFGKIIFDPTRGEKLVQTAAEHKREKEISRLEKQREYDELTGRTIR